MLASIKDMKILFLIGCVLLNTIAFSSTRKAYIQNIKSISYLQYSKPINSFHLLFTQKLKKLKSQRKMNKKKYLKLVNYYNGVNKILNKKQTSYFNILSVSLNKMSDQEIEDVYIGLNTFYKFKNPSHKKNKTFNLICSNISDIDLEQKTTRFHKEFKVKSFRKTFELNKHDYCITHMKLSRIIANSEGRNIKKLDKALSSRDFQNFYFKELKLLASFEAMSAKFQGKLK